MRGGMGGNRPGHDASGRHAENRAEEARLGLLLERTYAAREARLAPADDALAKINIALDAIGTPSQRYTDHRRLFGACALVALLLLLLSPIAHTEITGRTRSATQPVVVPIGGAGGARDDLAMNGRPAPTLLPVTIAASEGHNATGRAPDANGTVPVAGVSETPLRDLLARAGIQASDPAGASSDGQPPQH